MPLNIYILVALALTAVIHPHARHIVVRQSSKPIIAIGLITFFVLISPLVIGVIHDVEVLKTLLGVAPDTGNFAKNASTLLQNYTQFHAPTSGSTLTPIYGLGLVLLIGLGIYRLISAKYTTKSYIISFWLVFLVPLMFFNPGIISITFIPVVLLIALAVDYLIINWYRLFPHNPYARAFGLLPLAVLMIGLIVSSVDRYVYGLHYDRAVYSTYSYDLPVLTDKLRTLENDQPVTLVVAPNKLEFYSSFARHQNIIDTLSVTSSTTEAKRAQLAIVERSMKSGFTKSPSEILVTRTSANADRFYLYKNS